MNKNMTESYLHTVEKEMQRKCLKAVEDEPELPGPMPDLLWELWQAAKDDKEAVENFLRILVRVNKKGITERIKQIE